MKAIIREIVKHVEISVSIQLPKVDPLALPLPWRDQAPIIGVAVENIPQCIGRLSEFRYSTFTRFSDFGGD